MNLNFFNNLGNNNKNNDGFFNDIENFIKDLTASFNSLSNPLDEIDIVTQIISKEKVSLATENGIYLAREKAIKNYALENSTQLYYVYNKVKNSNNYRVIKIDGNKECMLEINKERLPANASVNSAMKEKNGVFYLDTEATNTININIREEAKKLIGNQNQKISNYKIEGHIYLVTEDINNRIFLYDITSNPKFEIEEINFPKELLPMATEGRKFIYKDGSYKLFD